MYPYWALFDEHRREVRNEAREASARQRRALAQPQLLRFLAGLAEARLSEESLQDSFKPCRLYHPACVTCYHTGVTCRNF